MKHGILCAALATVMAAPSPALAECADDRAKVADLGIASLECNCNLQRNEGQVTWRFRGEPVVLKLRSGSPAAAVLREGDVITALDGHLITTREGGRRFGEIEVGRPVTLSVRRDGRSLTARLAPEAVCPEETMAGAPMAPLAPLPPMPPVPTMPRAARPATPAPAPAAPEPGAGSWELFETPETPEPPGARRAPRASRSWRWGGETPRVHEIVPRGYFGMSLNCSDCRSERGPGEGPVWSFSTPPEITMIEPESPAARAGLRAGDVLVAIDRVALSTAEGGKLFGAVKPGQTVEFTVLRDGAVTRVKAVAGRRGEPRVVVEELLDRVRRTQTEQDSRRLAEEMRALQSELSALRARQEAQGRRLRYAGSVGGSDVEVRGLQNVIVDDSGDEIVIITSDARIVIKPSPRGGDKKKK